VKTCASFINPLPGFLRSRALHRRKQPGMARAVQLICTEALAMSIVRARLAVLIPLATLALSLNGCRVVGGIFKAGFWVGIIAVVLVIGLVFAVVRMLGRSR
jgi:Na+/H+-translocating membrane pyrophosphatase